MKKVCKSGHERLRIEISSQQKLQNARQKVVAIQTTRVNPWSL